jgi:guanylate kinase
MESKITKSATRPLLIVISGPSAAGKDTILQILKIFLCVSYRMAVTTTSRPMRPGEREGADYYFVDDARFKSMIDNQELVEWSQVYGQYKGISRKEIDSALTRGEDIVLRIDVQGAAKVRQLYPEAVLIFIMPGSMSDLEERIHKRGCDKPNEIALRLETAKEEVKQASCFDYVVTNLNRKPELAAADVAAILCAEHLRPFSKETFPTLENQTAKLEPSGEYYFYARNADIERFVGYSSEEDAEGGIERLKESGWGDFSRIFQFYVDAVGKQHEDPLEIDDFCATV